MNYDDWKSRDPIDGQWDGHEREEHVRQSSCRYCERRERQVLWPPEAPTAERCQVCGETRAMREVTLADLAAQFAVLVRR
jgi:hypothetical protein